MTVPAAPLRHAGERRCPASIPEDDRTETDDENRRMMVAVQQEAAAIYRECIYALQGISGERMAFYCNNHDEESWTEWGFRLDPSVQAWIQTTAALPFHRGWLGSGAVDAIYRCGAAGSLVRHIQSVVTTAASTATLQHQQQQQQQQQQPDPFSSGSSFSMARALICSVRQELTDYQEAILTVEKEAPSFPNNNCSHGRLRELVIFMEGPIVRLQTLAMMIMGNHNNNPNSPCMLVLSGPDLWTHLHRHSHHGDQLCHVPLVTQLLQATARPWFHRLYQWTVHGQLLHLFQDHSFQTNNNKFNAGTAAAAAGLGGTTATAQKGDAPPEFFITAVPNVLDRDLWRRGYRLDRSRIPVGILPAAWRLPKWNVEKATAMQKMNNDDDDDLIDLIFIVGKGVNFIRRCLKDADWSLSELEELPLAVDNENLSTIQNSNDETRWSQSEPSSMRSQRLAQLGFAYNPLSPINDRSPPLLCRTLNHSAVQIHSHILKSLRNEHGLFQHLFALKQFLLMGQGDFYSSLLEGIHTEYFPDPTNQGNRNAGNLKQIVHRHSLMAIVDSAVRSTNASNFSPQVLQRLRVSLILLSKKEEDSQFMFAPPRETSTTRMVLSLSEEDTAQVDSANADERTVWDMFLLDYDVPDALAAIVHPDALLQYQSIFRFLFQLNKVEYLLSSTWRQSSVLQRALLANAQHLVIKIGTNQAYAQAMVLLRQIAMTRQSMVHFVVHVKSYLMFEVLESNWKAFSPIIEEAQTLDDLIRAHDKYLSNVVLQSRLYSNEEKVDGIDLAGQIASLLQLTGRFCSYQKEIFEDALGAADRAAQKRRDVELLTHQGAWGFNQQREASEQETCFGLSDTTKLYELDKLSEDFNEQMLALLRALDTKLNGGPVILRNDRNGNAPATPSGDVGKRRVVDVADDSYDLESLRFLASQLAYNNFYGAVKF